MLARWSCGRSRARAPPRLARRASRQLPLKLSSPLRLARSLTRSALVARLAHHHRRRKDCQSSAMLVPVDPHKLKPWLIRALEPMSVHLPPHLCLSLPSALARLLLPEPSSPDSQTRLALHSSDAEPLVLADYVLALLKRDVRDLDELRHFCVHQLDDFLEQRASFPLVSSYAPTTRRSCAALAALHTLTPAAPLPFPPRSTSRFGRLRRLAPARAPGPRWLVVRAGRPSLGRGGSTAVAQTRAVASARGVVVLEAAALARRRQRS